MNVCDMTFKKSKGKLVRRGFFLQIDFFLDVKKFGDCDFEYAFEAK